MYAAVTRLGYRWGFEWHWLYLGWDALCRGRLDEPRELLARSVAASDEVGDPVTTVSLLIRSLRG
jgi:hypothetical protein